ncbi:MAG: protein phosphatase 2C domain-containing protein [Pyrinomonadaceae bacterium]|nr:protein phosphatase 2C domain-containing protein [Pyrinomonadaceae bacterium]
MNAHSAFVAGNAHEVCQDYAVSGCIESTPYVILADGCSSSPDTDTGARLLVKSAERSLRAHIKCASPFLQEEHEEAARLALRHANVLQLAPQCVDATLLTINVSGDNFFATCYGDGVVALQSRDGQLDVYSISFAEGYPRYPSYASQGERLRMFESHTSNVKEITHYTFFRGDDAIATHADTHISHDALETFTGSVKDYEFVAILSDGFHSFVELIRTETSRKTEPVRLEHFVGNLLDFKNTGGAFVRRRLNKFLSDAQKNKWQHNDDLAIGVVYLGG